MDGWMGESVGVGLCVGMSGTLTARVYVVQVHGVQQIVEPALCESNSRASAAPHPCVGDRWALCLSTQALKLPTGPVLVHSVPDKSAALLRVQHDLGSASCRFALPDSGTRRERQTVKFHKIDKKIIFDQIFWFSSLGNGKTHEKFENKKIKRKIASQEEFLHC